MSERERPAAEVVAATDEAQIQQCIQIRIDVFCHEQKFPQSTEVDEYDQPGCAAHFLLRSVPDHRPLGTVRIIEKPCGYKLTRLCIHKEYRGMHFGEELVKNAHSWVIIESKRAGRPAEIMLHSQIYAKAFYSREGYVPEGPEFDEEGAPHQRMVWRAPAPSVDTDTNLAMESS
ncbi:hypothetical protein FRC08_012635 [Ceratobasidium sp. 394]|nr:hypothetical protein FRC08_012635 [Ceratobasidium sp. 394]